MKADTILTASLALTALPVCAQDVQERPNILWLTYEDTSPQFIGCYGDKNAKTPNMDKLASEGVRFTSAFSTGAVSSPSRFCIFTGVRPTTMSTGHHRSAHPAASFIKGFPEYLREAGYYTTNNSKTDYNMAQAHALTKTAWDVCSGKADWRTRKPGQPFFAIYNSPSSHQSRTMTNPWEVYTRQVLDKLNPSETTQGGELEMPKFYYDSPQMQKHLSRVYNSITLTDKEFGEWLDRLEEDGLRDNTIIFCFSDHGQGIPRGKGSALGLGFRVPFIAWFPPKYAHLSPWGTAGVVTDELISFEDLAATMLSIAGIEIPDYMEGRAILGSEREKEKKYVFSAVDRIGECSDLSRGVTDGQYLYTRTFHPYMPYMWWSKYFDVAPIQKQMRKDYFFNNDELSDDQRGIFAPRSTECLYDLKNDKWEVVNLVGDKQQSKRLKKFRGVLRDYLTEKRDAHFIPEYYVLKAAKNTTAYQMRLDDKFYPVDKVMDLVYLDAKDSKTLGKLVEALKSESPVLRFWAAVGLYQQPKAGIYAKQVWECINSHEMEPASVYLAAALFKSTNSAKARALLVDYINHTDGELSRMALQTIFYMDEHKLKGFRPEIEAFMANGVKNTHFDAKEYCDMYLHYYGDGRELTYNMWW